MYVGYSRVLRIAEEVSFRSSTFVGLATVQGIDLQFSAIEAHKAIGPGERYNAPCEGFVASYVTYIRR